MISTGQRRIATALKRGHAIGVLVTIAAGVVVTSPSTAIADTAGPTDYRSEVVAVDPPTPSIAVSIVGGDSFVLLRVDPGVEVDVVGYEGEPYLHFAADGTVYENRRSAATYINGSRYGGGAIPDVVSPDAEPEWAEVAASGGEYAWHDHRAHLMQPSAPAGARRGEQVFAAVVPIVVDGISVEVRIASTWMPAPSRWPVVLGAIVGAILIVGALVAPSHRARGPVLAGAGAVAAVIGWIGYASLPSVTDPRPVWWLLPVLALMFAIGAWVLGPTPAGDASAAIAGLELAAWALDRRAGLTRAVLPTDAPYWVDRAVTAGALTVGLLAALAAIAGLIRSMRRAPARSV
jgi:hypothetical protein